MAVILLRYTINVIVIFTACYEMYTERILVIESYFQDENIRLGGFRRVNICENFNLVYAYGSQIKSIEFKPFG